MTLGKEIALRKMEQVLDALDTSTLLEVRGAVDALVAKIVADRLQRKNSEDSPLLRLPRELRDSILSHALVDRWAIDIPCRDDPETNAKRGVTPYEPPALLAASRQLREEGTPIYYERNAFDTATDTLVAWLEAMPAKQRGLVRTIRCSASCRIHYWHHDRAQACVTAKRLEEDLGLAAGTVWAETFEGEEEEEGDRKWVGSSGMEKVFDGY